MPEVIQFEPLPADKAGIQFEEEALTGEQLFGMAASDPEATLNYINSLPDTEAMAAYVRFRKHKAGVEGSILEGAKGMMGRMWEGGKELASNIHRPTEAAEALGRGAILGTADLGYMTWDAFTPETDDTYQDFLRDEKLEDNDASRAAYVGLLRTDMGRWKKELVYQKNTQEFSGESPLPAVTEAGREVLDPTMFVGVGAGVKGMKLARQAAGEGLTKAGDVTRMIGRGSTKAGEFPAKAAAKLAGPQAGKELGKATTGLPGVHTGAIGAAVVSPALAIPAGAKMAGGVLDTAGDIMQATGKAMGEGVGRSGLMGRASQLATTEAGKHLTKAASYMDPMLSAAGSVGAGVTAGAVVGGMLGGLSSRQQGELFGWGSPELWEGLGGGMALGGAGGFIGHGISVGTGLARRGRVAEDAEAFRATLNDEQAVLFDRFNNRMTELGNHEAVAELIDAKAWLGDEVTVTLVDEAGAAALTGQPFKGVHLEGDNSILINVDRADGGTAFHESFHGAIRTMAGRKYGKTMADYMLDHFTAGQIRQHVQRYLDMFGLKPGSKGRAAKLKELMNDLPRTLEEVNANMFMDFLRRRENRDLLLRGRKGVDGVILGLLARGYDSILGRSGIRDDGNLTGNRGMDALFRELIEARGAISQRQAQTGRPMIPVKTKSPEEAIAWAKEHGQENALAVDESGKVTGLKTEKEVSIARRKWAAQHNDALKAIKKLNKDKTRWFSDKQVEALRELLPESEHAKLVKVNDAIREGRILEAENFPATKKVGEATIYASRGMTINRVLPHKVSITASGNINIGVLDLSMLASRADDYLARQGKLEPWKGDKAQAQKDIRRYLENLEQDNPIPSADLLGGGREGAKKRDIIQKIFGFVRTKKQVREGSLINESLEGLPTREESGSPGPESIGRPLFESDGNTRVTKSYRLDRMGRVEATGETLNFSDKKAYRLGQVNFMPDDAAYLDAANRGDVETAQRMVDEAAKAAGYTIGPVYHGTAGEAFTTWSFGEKGIPVRGAAWFSLSPNPARYISDARVRHAGQKDGRILKGFLAYNNPLTVDAKGGHAADVSGISDAKERGYDAVIIENVREFGAEELTTSVAVFSPNQIKSADPVTRDDQGNVIPLSERFQSGSDDIRFMPDAAMDALPSGEGAVEKRVAIPRRGRGGNVPEMSEIRAALSDDRKPKVGVGDKLKAGDPVGLRIDIPAFERTLENPVSKTGEPTYAVSVHGKWKGKKGGGAGTIVGYENLVRVKNPVFMVNEKAAAGIRGGKTKSTIATVEGAYVKSKAIPSDISNWTQVGMNPKRHSYFYDRATGEPVVGGTEALSVGGTVFVKDAEFGSRSDFRFQPDIGDQDSLGMFSAAERAAVDLKQNKGSASQMLAMIKKAGVKDEELQALGLDKFLEGNRKVTKDEIIDHLVENQITVEETVLGGERELRQVEEMMQGGDEPIGAEGAATKHSEYVEPGAVEGSYRELLLRLPEPPGVHPSIKEYYENVLIPEREAAGKPVRYRRWEDVNTAGDAVTYAWVLEKYRAFKDRALQERGAYTGGHYGEHPNVLAHMRVNDRIGPKGEKILHTEEIQSDWHQEGRKKGYKSEARVEQLKQELRKAQNELEDAKTWKAEEHTEYVRPLEERRAAILDEMESLSGGRRGGAFPADYAETITRLHNEIKDIDRRLKGPEVGEILGRIDLLSNELDSRQVSGLVPDAPFKTSWHELAMKRLIRYAVDNGYDAISWTTGDTQFKRYGSSEIAWVRDGDGWNVKATEQRGGEAGGIDIEGAARAEGILKEGGDRITTKQQLRELIEANVTSRERGQWSEENYNRHVDKLTDRVWERMQKEDAGTSLPRREGMVGFYDKMLPRMKIWKKLGLKVEEGEVGLRKYWEGSPQEIVYPIPGHIVRLSPEARESVSQRGLPQFTPKRDRRDYNPGAGLGVLRGDIPTVGLPSKPTVLEAAQWFQNRIGNPLDWKKATPEQVEAFDNAAVAEVKNAMELHPEAAGWYDENLGLATSILREVDPSLAQPRNDFFLKLMTALTSDGNEVSGQFNQAWDTYSHWRDTGKYTGKFASGDRVGNIRNNIKRGEALVRQLGGEENARDWLMRKGTISEVREAAQRDLGMDKKTAMKIGSGELVDAVVPYAVIFGPKLGSFFNNLFGDYSSVTMDRWFMRTIGRLTGTQVEKISATQIASARGRVRTAFDSLKSSEKKSLNATKSDAKGTGADVVAKKLSTHFSKTENRKGISPAMNELRLAANSLTKLGKPLVEAPTTGKHRKWIRQRIDNIQKKLKDEGIELENADLQALLWYNEKELYNAIGVRSRSGAADYASAAESIHERVRGGPSRSFAEGTGRVGRVGRSEGDVGVGRQGSKGKVASPAKTKFLPNDDRFTPKRDRRRSTQTPGVDSVQVRRRSGGGLSGVKVFIGGKEIIRPPYNAAPKDRVDPGILFAAALKSRLKSWESRDIVLSNMMSWGGWRDYDSWPNWIKDKHEAFRKDRNDAEKMRVASAESKLGKLEAKVLPWRELQKHPVPEIIVGGRLSPSDVRLSDERFRDYVFQGEGEPPDVVDIKIDGEQSRRSKSTYNVVTAKLSNGAVIGEMVRISDHGQVSVNSPRHYDNDLRYGPELDDRLRQLMQDKADERWNVQKAQFEDRKKSPRHPVE